MEKRQATYWAEIRPVWWDEIKSWFGWGNWKQTVTTLIIAVGAILLLLLAGRIDIVIDEVWLRMAALLIGVSWLLIVAVISYVNANKALHEKHKAIRDKQQKDIDKHTWNDVEILGYSFPESSGFGVGLRLINHKPIPYNIFPKIYIENGVLDGKPLIDKRLELFLVSASASVFTKSNVLMSIEDKITGKKIFAIPIANRKGNRVWIEARDEKGDEVKFMMENESNCVFNISLSGVAEGRDNEGRIRKITLDLCVVHCNLRYYADKDGEMKMSINVEKVSGT